jgi:hypothetical protein
VKQQIVDMTLNGSGVRDIVRVLGVSSATVIDVLKKKEPGLTQGFDHGVGHPLLLLYDAKAPNYRKNKAFKGLGHYSEWPKVADAVIKADLAFGVLA